MYLNKKFETFEILKQKKTLNFEKKIKNFFWKKNFRDSGIRTFVNSSNFIVSESLKNSQKNYKNH